MRVPKIPKSTREIYVGRTAFRRIVEALERLENPKVGASPWWLTRTFTTQVEALKRYRTGGEQRVTVQHVNVNEGGQAIVGNLSSPRGGVPQKKVETTS